MDYSILALHLLFDHHLSDRRFPDRTYPDHNNIPDHSIDVYIYPDLKLSRPTVILTISYPNQCTKIYALVGIMTISGNRRSDK